MTVTARRLAAAVGFVAAAAAAVSCLPAPPAAIIDVHTAVAANDLAQADRLTMALAALALWALLGWLTVIGIALAAAQIPGRLGAFADAVGSGLAPRIIQRALATLLGVAVLTGCAATSAQAANAQLAANDPPPGSSHSVNLDWPIDGQQPLPEPVAPPPSVEAGAPGSVPSRPGSETVVVPGDTLWTIAAQHLGPAALPVQIAQEWPRWWQANRLVIGDDPDLIQPGQKLQAPQ